ncbi:MAG: phage holin family protein [Steroidobacterales bacterium]
MAGESREPGLIGTLKRMFSTLLLLAKSRLELVSIEVEEQVAYAANLLVWSMVAIACASLGVFFLGATIIIACWDRYRLLAASLVTAAFVLMALGAVSVVRSRLRQRPQFLAATIVEFTRDAGQS